MLGLAATLASGVPVYRVTMPTLKRADLPEPVRDVLAGFLGAGLG